MKDNRMDNIWQTHIKFVVYIFFGNSNSEFSPHSFNKKDWRWSKRRLQICLSCHKTGLSKLGTLPINRKDIYETRDIELFIDSNLNFTICNLGHNILELCNVLVQIQLTTSKTKRDI